MAAPPRWRQGQKGGEEREEREREIRVAKDAKKGLRPPSSSRLPLRSGKKIVSARRRIGGGGGRGVGGGRRKQAPLSFPFFGVTFCKSSRIFRDFFLPSFFFMGPWVQQHNIRLPFHIREKEGLKF